MSITAQTVVNGVSQDVRTQLPTTSTILLDYVDRIHKDVLHTSIHAHLNHAVVTVSTVASTTNYALGVVPRKINFVFDRTRSRVIWPLAAMPSQDAQGNHTKVHSSLPEYYKMVSTGTLYLVPTPQQVLTLEVHYESNVSTLAALSTVLTVPEDALDMMIAGTNALAYAFLQKNAEAAQWQSVYEKLKQGEAVLQ